jgi:hypothetical protein
MRIRFSALRALAGIALLSSLGGCIFTSPDIPAFLKNTSGSNQEVAPNAPAPAPLTVTVRDQDGNTMENITVEWSIKSGSGTLSANQTTTNDDGQASVNYTAGASTGNTTIVAAVPVLGSAVAFVLVVK